MTAAYIKQRMCSLEKPERGGQLISGRIHADYVSIQAADTQSTVPWTVNSPIFYGTACCIFGPVLIAFGTKGITHISFATTVRENAFHKQIKDTWPDARIVHDKTGAAELAGRIFEKDWNSADPFVLVVKGSPFRLRIWQTVLSVPEGSCASYAGIARYAGNSKAVRAAASAIASNPVLFLIPCHRIVRSDGTVNSYSGGNVLKKMLLEQEMRIG